MRPKPMNHRLLGVPMSFTYWAENPSCSGQDCIQKARQPVGLLSTRPARRDMVRRARIGRTTMRFLRACRRAYGVGGPRPAKEGGKEWAKDGAVESQRGERGRMCMACNKRLLLWNC